MIVIDTEILKHLAGIAGRVNEEIRDAADILNSVTTHNDWGCSERDTINNFTIQNKTKIKQISDASSNFYNIINSVSDEFAMVERDIPSMFSSVDSIIGHVISIPVPVSINPSGMKDIASEIVKYKQWKSSTQEVIKKITEPIAIVMFDEIDLKN